MKSKPKIFNATDPVEVNLLILSIIYLQKVLIYHLFIDAGTVIIYFMLQKLIDLKFAVIVEQKLIGVEIIQ